MTQSTSFEGAPDIPPITKVMPGFPFPKPFFGYYGPPRLPAPVIAKLTDEINKVLALPEVKALAKLSIAPLVTSHPEFTALVQDTATTFQQIIKAADIQLQ